MTNETHTNKEKLRKCPYCGETIMSRGLFAHVFNSDNSDHGRRGSVPDGFEVEDTEIVGERDVSVSNPTNYEVEEDRYVCDYCGENFRGKMGLKIHLGRKAGEDSMHPNDAPERDMDTFESFTPESDTQEGEEVQDSLARADNILRDLRSLHEQLLREDEENRTISAYHAAERVEGILEKYD